jgi:NitT/TauT family transport system ATP-binding protein
MSHPPRPLIVLDDVGKVYPRGTEALRHVCLSVGQPEFISLVGPSGCGKSTVLRLLAGLGTPTAGRIVWPGQGTRRAGAGDIGFVFQDPTLMPWATVEDNVMLPVTLVGGDRREARERALLLLSRMGLDGFGRAYPRELSGGMRMRVSLARALLTRPSVLLMDEPFAAVDEITRFELIESLLALWQGQPWTIVFVTHSVYESVYMSQRVAVMGRRPGRVVDDIAIPEPYPRTQSFRGSARYADYCAQVLDALKTGRTRALV